MEAPSSNNKISRITTKTITNNKEIYLKKAAIFEKMIFELIIGNCMPLYKCMSTNKW